MKHEKRRHFVKLNLYLLAILALVGQIHGFIVTGDLLQKHWVGWVVSAIVFFVFVLFILNAVFVIRREIDEEGEGVTPLPVTQETLNVNEPS